MTKPQGSFVGGRLTHATVWETVRCEEGSEDRLTTELSAMEIVIAGKENLATGGGACGGGDGGGGGVG